MLSAYFDVSGNETDEVLTMAGFVSHVKMWERFEHEWRALLPPSVKMFHMTDFASSRNGWEEWKGDSKRRALFFQSLIDCIKANTKAGFASSLKIPDFQGVNAEYRLGEQIGTPYTFLARACFGRVRMWAQKKPASWKKIICVLEDGDQGQYEALQALRKDGFDVIVQNKTLTRAFDTCDLAAWKARRIIHDSYYQNKMSDKAGTEKIFASLDQLETIIRRKEVGMFSTKSLRLVCQDQEVPPR